MIAEKTFGCNRELLVETFTGAFKLFAG